MFNLFNNSGQNTVRLYPAEIDRFSVSGKNEIILEECCGILLGTQTDSVGSYVDIEQVKNIIRKYSEKLIREENLSCIINSLIIVRAAAFRYERTDYFVNKAQWYSFYPKTYDKWIRGKTGSGVMSFSANTYFVLFDPNNPKGILDLVDDLIFQLIDEFYIYKTSYGLNNRSKHFSLKINAGDFINASFADWLQSDDKNTYFYSYKFERLQSGGHIENNRLGDKFIANFAQSSEADSIMLDINKCLKSYFNDTGAKETRLHRDAFLKKFFSSFTHQTNEGQRQAILRQEFLNRPNKKDIDVRFENIRLNDNYLNAYLNESGKLSFDEYMDWESCERRKQSIENENKIKKEHELSDISEKMIEPFALVLIGVCSSLEDIKNSELYQIAKSYIDNNFNGSYSNNSRTANQIGLTLVCDETELVDEITDPNIANALRAIIHRNPCYLEKISSSAWGFWGKFIYEKLTREGIDYKELREQVSAFSLQTRQNELHHRMEMRMVSAQQAEIKNKQSNNQRLSDSATVREGIQAEMETKVVKVYLREMQDVIDKYSKEGWKLVSNTIGFQMDGTVYDYLLTFERAKPEIKAKTGSLQDRLNFEK